jgi:hypothetical protein
MTKLNKWIAGAATMLATVPAFAQDGPIKAPTAEQMAGMVDKGDTTWMLVSSALVLLMSITNGKSARATSSLCETARSARDVSSAWSINIRGSR